MCPSTLIIGTANEHFCFFRVIPLFSIELLEDDLTRFCACPRCWTMAKYYLKYLHSSVCPLVMLWIWKYSPEGQAPMINLLNLYGPSSGVEKAVICLDSGAKDICKYPCFICKLPYYNAKQVIFFMWPHDSDSQSLSR